MMRSAWVLSALFVLSFSGVAGATDCRDSKTQECFFSASALILGAERLPVGEMYFKTGLGYSPPVDSKQVFALPNGQSSVVVYDRVTGEKSAEIARVGAPDATGEAYPAQLAPNVRILNEGVHDETYTYCSTGPFGISYVTALKTVSEAGLVHKDGTPVIGSATLVLLRNESNFREISRRLVIRCPN